jgi:hypothetical protein
MKGSKQKFVLWATVVVASLGVTYWWFNDSRIAPFSESLWSLYNGLFAGQRPGLATDLEFLTVLLGSILVVGSVAWTIWRVVDKRVSTKR